MKANTRLAGSDRLNTHSYNVLMFYWCVKFAVHKLHKLVPLLGLIITLCVYVFVSIVYMPILYVSIG